MTANQIDSTLPRNAALTGRLLRSLDRKYGLFRKTLQERETGQVIAQFIRRLEKAFGSLAEVQGKRILDIGCGTSASRDPRTGRITPMFEPWFCRSLVELGADAVGVDIGDLEGEPFEHYRVDLGQPGALDFLPDSSFDGVHDSRIFGSPEFTGEHPDLESYRRISCEIKKQEQRLLRPGGITIHTDIE